MNYSVGKNNVEIPLFECIFYLQVKFLIGLLCFTLGKMDIHGTTDEEKWCVCIIYTRKPSASSF